MNSYVVIGLGRFGAELATRLYAAGEEVLAVDVDPAPVDRIADGVTRAVAADARDRAVLEKLGVGSFDRAVVAIGTDLGASALITMNLKALGVPFVLCKAHDNTHREILEKLGADRVVIPEWEMADKLALGMTHAGILEYIELSEEYGILEIEPRDAWIGKTIRSLELRSRFGVNVIALRRGDDQIRIPPDIDEPLTADVQLVALGSYDMLEKIRN